MAPIKASRETMTEFMDKAIADVAMVGLKALKNPHNIEKELLHETTLLLTKKAFEHGASQLPEHYAYALTQNTTTNIADGFAIKGMSLSHLAGEFSYGSLLGAGASWIVKVTFLLCAYKKYRGNRKQIIIELLKITFEEIFGFGFTIGGKLVGGVLTLGNVVGMIGGGLLGNMFGKYLFKKICKFIKKNWVKKGGYKTLTYEYGIEEGFDIIKSHI